MARKKSENIETVENPQDITEIAATNNKKYKTEKCRVLLYNQATKELDIDFHGYGIRIKNADNINSDSILLKYTGEIGKPDFSYKI